MTDPIADMLSRIRNALMAEKSEVIIPCSKIKYEIAKIFEKNHLIAKVDKIKSLESTGENITVQLKYHDDKTPVITHIKRISKPGRRVYVGKNRLPIVLNHYGLAIISTPEGLMTNREAKRKGLGGEIICEIY